MRGQCARVNLFAQSLDFKVTAAIFVSWVWRAAAKVLFPTRRHEAKLLTAPGAGWPRCGP